MTTPPPDQNPLLAAALGYASRGWPVVPLHTPSVDGRCSCRKADCIASCGKHPRTMAGLVEATTAVHQIRQWWMTWPDANIGVVTGQVSGIVVLDIDPRHNGDETLAGLEGQHGSLPSTMQALTGSRGRHVLFCHPGRRVSNTAGRLGPGLDTRGDGGYIVAAPSLHASGRKYEWDTRSPGPGGVHQRGADLAELPAWLEEAIRPPPAPVAPAAPLSPDSALRRATAWMAKREPAVEGQGGDPHTFRTAAMLVRDFALPVEDSWRLLLEWNAKCVPPWGERALRAKLDSAVRNGKHAEGSAPDRPRLSLAPQREEPPPPDDSDAPPELETDGSAAKVVSLSKKTRGLTSRSYLSVVTILETPRLRARVIGDRPLEFNEMTGEATLARVPMQDVNYSEIRAELERNFEGDDKGGGMKFSLDDVFRAVQQVAQQAKFHPVREYLGGLKWDGHERIGDVCKEILGAEPTPLNRTIVRRFFISAVARAMKPGVKVDTMLILVGSQGALKSTFLKTLAGAWFCDEAIDIHNKDALLTISQAWILEWGELESMAKARDIDALKGFLSKEVDRYRPPYGKHPIAVPRSCVFAGTTNRPEFLTDDTGERRFWPLVVGLIINMERLRAERDQLWAEALHAFNEGERWWLTRDEDKELALVHQRHAVTDAWTEPVMDWVHTQDHTALGWPTLAQVIAGALAKPMGQWTRQDEMRVNKILIRSGFERVRAPRTVTGTRPWVWRPKSTAEQTTIPGVE